MSSTAEYAEIANRNIWDVVLLGALAFLAVQFYWQLQGWPPGKSTMNSKTRRKFADFCTSRGAARRNGVVDSIFAAVQKPRVLHLQTLNLRLPCKTKRFVPNDLGACRAKSCIAKIANPRERRSFAPHDESDGCKNARCSRLPKPLLAYDAVFKIHNSLMPAAR